MAIPEKQDALFELVKSMSKAEKRHFKLFAARSGGSKSDSGADSKFVALFDAMDALGEYDAAKIIARSGIKKQQLPNLKAHLYKQLLIALRLLEAQRSPAVQLREQIDFSHILYDRGLYRQSARLLEKAAQRSMELEQRTLALGILDFQRNLETLSIAKGMSDRSELLTRTSSELCAAITSTNELANICVQLYDLYQKLGYARTQKDLDMLEVYFGPRLKGYRLPADAAFLDKYYYYQSMAWYSYIRHDFLGSYRYAARWVALFEAAPRFKTLMYESYLRGYARILDGLFMMRKHRTFLERLDRFARECATVGSINDNAVIISRQILYTGRINRCFLLGHFGDGMELIPQVEHYIARFSANLTLHTKMMLYYKLACLSFGDGDWERCMGFLSKITLRKEPQIRRDLQCYAKILQLIASWESGKDEHLDSQIRSVYAFLSKMNDLGGVQREMLAFLRRLPGMYQSDFQSELRTLYNRLKPYGQHPYERRTFYYLDILSWLESKLTGRTIAEVIRTRYLMENKK